MRMPQTVYSTSSGSELKMLTKSWGTDITAIQKRKAYPTQMPNWQAKALFTRSALPAPKL